MNLARFLRLGALVNPLPYNIQNGQVEDAVPVMANFNWLVSQVNANVAAAIAGTATSGLIFVPAGSVGGSGNAITLSPTPALSAYAAGQSLRFVATATNTGGVTINTSGLGNRLLTLANGNVLIGGELHNGGVYDVCDNGSNYVLVNFPAGSALLSWAPALTFGGAASGMTYSTQLGRVMTFGNLVIALINLQLSNKGASTGVAAVSLPVVPNASLIGGGGIPMGGCMLGFTTFTGIPTAVPNPGVALVNILCMNSGGVFNYLNHTNFTNTSIINLFVIYPA